LAEVKEAYRTETKTSADLNRAQLSAQSSHRFLRKAMDATDELQKNTGKKGALKGAVLGGTGGGFYLGFDRTCAGNGAPYFFWFDSDTNARHWRLKRRRV
jgi:hypothetical protein